MRYIMHVYVKATCHVEANSLEEAKQLAIEDYGQGKEENTEIELVMPEGSEHNFMQIFRVPEKP